MDSLSRRILTSYHANLDSGRLKLPSLPDVVMDTWELLRHPDTRGEDLAKVIRRDPVLSARLVAIANSAFYKRRRSVSGVQQAVVVLGEDVVRHIVGLLGVAELYKVPTGSSLHLLLNREWIHSTLVAGLSEAIASRWGHLSGDVAMLAGMVHRIGVIPVLTLAERYPDVIGRGDLLERVVRDLHTQTGVDLLTRWNFPDDLVTVVRMHEDPSALSPGDPDYVTVVRAATQISARWDRQSTEGGDWCQTDAEARLGIEEADVDELAEYCGPRVRELRALLKSHTVHGPLRPADVR